MSRKNTNTEILTKAIQKAKSNGWMKNVPDGRIVVNEDLKITFGPASGLVEGIQISYSDLIFNNDFARALWGEERGYIVTDSEGGQSFSSQESVSKLSKQGVNWVAPLLPVELWQYHLQRMVIAEAPLKYLGENIWTTKHYPL